MALWSAITDENQRTGLAELASRDMQQNRLTHCRAYTHVLQSTNPILIVNIAWCKVLFKRKKRKSIYIAPLVYTVYISKRSGMDRHIVLPANTPCMSLFRWRSLDGATPNWGRRHQLRTRETILDQRQRSDRRPHWPLTSASGRGVKGGGQTGDETMPMHTGLPYCPRVWFKTERHNVLSVFPLTGWFALLYADHIPAVAAECRKCPRPIIDTPSQPLIVKPSASLSFHQPATWKLACVPVSDARAVFVELCTGSAEQYCTTCSVASLWVRRVLIGWLFYVRNRETTPNSLWRPLTKAHKGSLRHHTIWWMLRLTGWRPGVVDWGGSVCCSCSICAPSPLALANQLPLPTIVQCGWSLNRHCQ